MRTTLLFERANMAMYIQVEDGRREDGEAVCWKDGVSVLFAMVVVPGRPADTGRGCRGQPALRDERRESLINPLRDGAEWEGDPALVTNKEFGEADIVGNECGDDTKSSAGLGGVHAVKELACKRGPKPISDVRHTCRRRMAYRWQGART